MNGEKTAGLLLTLLFLFVPLPTLGEGLYAGVQYAFLKYKQKGLDEVNPTVLSLRGGIEVNDRVAFEARLGFGAGDDSANGIEFEVDKLAGLYAKATIITDATVSPYVIGGWTYLDIDENYNEISYGAGIDVKADKNISITIEYMAVTDNFDKKADIDSVQLGFTYKF